MRRELAQHVRVVGLTLANGWVQRNHHQSVGRVGLGKYEEALDGGVADLEVLRLRMYGVWGCGGRSGSVAGRKERVGC